MKIGDRVYVHGYVDEIRKDTVIIRNEGGYFGTAKNEIVEAQKAEDIVSVIRCKDCRHAHHSESFTIDKDGLACYSLACYRNLTPHGVSKNDFCSHAERKEE